jgi:anti-sigma B factor antagonist
MLIEFEYRDDVCILRPRGRFVTGLDAAYLRSKTEELRNSGCRKVLADFRDVPYVDSTGIGFLVGVYTTVTNAGGRFVIVGPQRRVREVLDLTRLSSVMPIAANEAAGLKFLRAIEPAAQIAKQK